MEISKIREIISEDLFRANNELHISINDFLLNTNRKKYKKLGFIMNEKRIKADNICYVYGIFSRNENNENNINIEINNMYEDIRRLRRELIISENKQRVLKEQKRKILHNKQMDITSEIYCSIEDLEKRINLTEYYLSL